MRRLGVTKVQIGVQSVSDRILALNRRGHTVEQTRAAFRLLRAAGFKIHAHWMPNLLGATPESDREDFARLWSDPDLRPDELKIYPTILVRSSRLYDYFERGEYIPYNHEQLIALLADIKPEIPPYCRLNRLARDIPVHHVVAGNRRSNLREDAQARLAERGRECRCIRCREVRGLSVGGRTWTCEELDYEAGGGEEQFLSFVTSGGRLAGYLRLSLPGKQNPDVQWRDLARAAIIRDLHVYGKRFRSAQAGREPRSIWAWAPNCFHAPKRLREPRGFPAWR